MSSPDLGNILSKIGDGLCVLDKDRQLTFANDKATKIFESADESFHVRIGRALEDRIAGRFDHLHTALQRWFEHQTYPNADGGLTVFSRDITARHRLEEALRASEDRFRRLMDSNIIGVLVVEAGMITESNDVFLGMVGYTRDDVVAKRLRWREMTPPEYDELDAGARYEVERNGVFPPYEKEFLRKNGTRVPILISGVETGKAPVETLCLAVDLSERKRAEQRLQIMLRETQNANRLKDEFVAIVSHELRTPLMPILGGVYMLRSDPQDSELFARAVDLIERNAKTQMRIIDDLLDVSRALSGKLRLNLQPVDLAAVIRAAVETVRPAGEAKNIRITPQLEMIGREVVGDADRLQQVVWNLLANSVKFTPNDGRIVVRLSQTGNDAEIAVTDTGIGIAAEFLPHVFERFRQADGSRTRLHGGLGLGLAIVRHLVESHGGTVYAHSPGDEQGSTFVVKLPLRMTARAANA
jgi:PAS domain S-box-containing protein